MGNQSDFYDLSKISSKEKILTYNEASQKYGVSLEETEPLWPLVENR